MILKNKKKKRSRLRIFDQKNVKVDVKMQVFYRWRGGIRNKKGVLVFRRDYLKQTQRERPFWA